MLRSSAALVSAATAGGAVAERAERALRHSITAKPPPGAEPPTSRWAPAHDSNITPAERPSDHAVEFVVIHVAQHTFDGTVAHFQNPDSDVSCHYVVASEDGRLAQCVRDTDIAWHAGNWDYNARSIGIEHEGWVDEPEWFTDAMYARSAALTAHLCAAYDIPVTRDHIIGHHEVPEATHTDPGPLWDWERYLRLVEEAGP